jgi:hypothetical protein
MDIDYFRARVRVNKNALDDELEQHADGLEKIGRFVASAAREEARLKRELERAEAEQVRDLMSDDPKLSHAKAVGDAKLKRPVRDAWEDHQAAKQRLLEWEALEKAWYQRGFDLKALAELYGSQYFVINSAGGGIPVDDRRRAMREASGSWGSQQTTKAERRGRAEEATPDEGPRRRRSLVND